MRLRLFFALFLLLSAGVSVAQDSRNLQINQSGEKRVALVIGNDTYRNVVPLKNAVADARAMAKEFRALGFEVIERTNIDQRGMKSALRDFVSGIANGGIGAFFYAGHGVQEGGNNYLLPVDIGALTDTAALPDEAVELNGDVMARIGQVGAKFSLLVIDACRDNPFPRKAGRSIGSTRGLGAAASAPEGMVVVYSAGVGQQALDRLGPNDRNPNGLFTREFVREIRTPGLEVAEVVRNVRRRVKDLAASVKHEQTPAIYIQADRFYLKPGDGAQVAQLSGAGSLARTPAQIEDELWDAIKESDTVAVFEQYLAQYPDGRYVTLANVRLIELRKKLSSSWTANPGPNQLAPMSSTGTLVWADSDNGSDINWEDAKNYCASKGNGWRLPTVSELQESYTTGQLTPCGQFTCKIASKTTLNGAWAWSSESGNAVDAWRVDLSDGSRGTSNKVIRLRVVRALCVRSIDHSPTASPQPNIANALTPRVFKDCADCPEMVVIPGGLAIGRTEVTQGQWRAIMENNPSFFLRCGDDCPVEQVSWNDVQEYLRLLSQRSGKSYRLPTENEWERACKAGTQQNHCGSNDIDSIAWHDANSSANTHPVAGKLPNAWGLYDMNGNVWEWTESCWDRNCNLRILRGGSITQSAKDVNAASRLGNSVTVRTNAHRGFRPVVTLQ